LNYLVAFFENDGNSAASLCGSISIDSFLGKGLFSATEMKPFDEYDLGSSAEGLVKRLTFRIPVNLLSAVNRQLPSDEVNF